VFVLAGKRLDGGKGKILLCSLKNPVREVFDIVGFSATFPVYASHEDALRNI
jgi:anti-sigma B factor antagonist